MVICTYGQLFYNPSNYDNDNQVRLVQCVFLGAIKIRVYVCRRETNSARFFTIALDYANFYRRIKIGNEMQFDITFLDLEHV